VRFALLQGTDDADIQITDVRNINDVLITEIQMRGLQMRGLPIVRYKMSIIEIGLRPHCANKNSMD
jgi:hypothetical protein